MSGFGGFRWDTVTDRDATPHVLAALFTALDHPNRMFTIEAWRTIPAWKPPADLAHTDPVSWADRHPLNESWRSPLPEMLVFTGLVFTDDASDWLKFPSRLDATTTWQLVDRWLTSTGVPSLRDATRRPGTDGSVEGQAVRVYVHNGVFPQIAVSAAWQVYSK